MNEKKPQPNPGVANPYIWDLGQRKRNKGKEWQGKIILGKVLLFRKKVPGYQKCPTRASKNEGKAYIPSISKKGLYGPS